jgi:hypothetical protein
MAQFSITLTVPDGTVASALAALQVDYPLHQGETNLVYIKRVIKELLVRQVTEGQARIAQNAITLPDLGVVTS